MTALGQIALVGKFPKPQSARTPQIHAAELVPPPVVRFHVIEDLPRLVRAEFDRHGQVEQLRGLGRLIVEFQEQPRRRGVSQPKFDGVPRADAEHLGDFPLHFNVPEMRGNRQIHERRRDQQQREEDPHLPDRRLPEARHQRHARQGEQQQQEGSRHHGNDRLQLGAVSFKEIRNPNLEIRNKFKIPNLKVPNPACSPAFPSAGLEFRIFGHWDLFRISRFGFRIFFNPRSIPRRTWGRL